MSEASDEEVDCGSFDIVANQNTDSDHDGVHQEITVKAKDKGILISKITGAEINSQYMKEYKPLMDKRSRFIFAVHEKA